MGFCKIWLDDRFSIATAPMVFQMYRYVTQLPIPDYRFPSSMARQSIHALQMTPPIYIRNSSSPMVSEYLIGWCNRSWMCLRWGHADEIPVSLRWRHNRHDSVSNHQPHHCLLNRLFRRRSKKTSKLRVTGLCVGNSPGTGEFPAQMARNAENVSIWLRHHDVSNYKVRHRTHL